jgi:hypothetical protein
MSVLQVAIGSSSYACLDRHAPYHAPVALGNGALAYVRFVRPFPSHDYSVEAWGLLLSLCGVAGACASLRCTQRFISALTLPISFIMVAVWFLMGSTY